MKDDMCLVDICTTSSIFGKYNVSALIKRSGNTQTIAARDNVIIDLGHNYYPYGYSSVIKDALLCLGITCDDNEEKEILFTLYGYGKSIIFLLSGLYYTYCKTRSICCIH